MPPRYLELAGTDGSGLRQANQLQEPLPYYVEPKDIRRLVEDLHELLHEVNGQLVDKGYERLEELLDSAGFSGLLSRAAVDKIARLSKQLVGNRLHNGYPDLLPKGMYPQDKAQHGTTGGLEVKASRIESAWQSHGPRAGWFLIVQFEIDDHEDKALYDREPTRVRAVMVARLAVEDWSWQPAKEGKIRSGTASVRPSGAAKLRNGAVWVDPTYEERHQRLLVSAKRHLLGVRRTTLVRWFLCHSEERSILRTDLYALVAETSQLSVDEVTYHVDEAVKFLRRNDGLQSTGRGAATRFGRLEM